VNREKDTPKFQFNNKLFMNFICKEPVEPLTLDEIADRCHCPEEVLFLSSLVYVSYVGSKLQWVN
jgi:hypothetical protein